MAGRGTVLGRSRKPVQEALRARGRRSPPKRTVRGEPPGSHTSVLTQYSTEPDAPRALPRSLTPRANIAAGINVLHPHAL